MKKMIGLFVLAASMSSLSAFAAIDESQRLIVSCEDARPGLADVGYIVNVFEDDNTGNQYAVVSQESRRGPRVLGSVSVRESLYETKMLYSGRAFKLSLSRDSMRRSGVHSAKLTYAHYIGGDAAETIRANLICIDQRVIAL